MRTLKMKMEKELTGNWSTSHLRDRGITRLSGWKHKYMDKFRLQIMHRD